MGKAIEGATSTNALDRLVEETLADGSRHAVEKYLSGSASPEVGTTPAARRTYTYYEDGSLMGLRAESGSQALEPTSQRDLLGRPVEANEQTRDPRDTTPRGSHSVVSLAWDTLKNRVHE